MTFAWISDDSVTTIEIEPENQNGEKIDLNKEVIMEKFGEARWHGLINKIVQIHDPVSLERRLRALWTVCVKSDPGLKEIRKINFYRVKVFTIPEAKANNLLSKELIYTLDL